MPPWDRAGLQCTGSATMPAEIKFEIETKSSFCFLDIASLYVATAAAMLWTSRSSSRELLFNNLGALEQAQRRDSPCVLMVCGFSGTCLLCIMPLSTLARASCCCSALPASGPRMLAHSNSIRSLRPDLRSANSLHCRDSSAHRVGGSLAAARISNRCSTAQGSPALQCAAAGDSNTIKARRSTIITGSTSSTAAALHQKPLKRILLHLRPFGPSQLSLATVQSKHCALQHC